MKKWWQNINRGILLLIIAIIAVTSYLISDSIKTKNEKAKLKEITTQFASDSSILFAFPQDIDFFSWDGMESDNLRPAMYSQTESLNHYFCDNEVIRKQEIDKSQLFFRNYYERQLCPISCTRSLVRIEINEIYNGSATISLFTENKIDYKDQDGKKGYAEIEATDTLVLLKIDGQWKIIKLDSTLTEYEGSVY